MLDSKVGALMGLGIEGEEGFEKGQRPPPKAWTSLPTQAWDVLADKPNDSVAVLILLGGPLGRCPCVTPSPTATT